MQIWRAGAVSVPAIHEFHLAKPAEEQKHIIEPHALPVQMALRTAVLPERREPSGLPTPSGWFEIRIDVGGSVRTHPLSSQI
jgi:hypothetical protein